jgi:hypothetical protein
VGVEVGEIDGGGDEVFWRDYVDCFFSFCIAMDGLSL